ncbi:hypothetical protein BST61_g10429 [Cercospora zeina]
MPQQASDEVEGLYNELGTGYEEAFGQNPAQIRFVQSTVQQLSLASFVPDIGCGTGQPTGSEVTSAGHRFLGIDSSSTMIDAARKNVQQAKFEVVDMLDYRGPSTPPNAIFAIFATFTLSHDETTRLMKIIGSWLKSNGLLFVGSMSAEELDTAEWTAQDAETGTVKRWFIGNQAESESIRSRAGSILQNWAALRWLQEQ